MILKCELCNEELGEIVKGKMKNNATLLCAYCWNSIRREPKVQSKPYYDDYDVPSFDGSTSNDGLEHLKNIFGFK